MDPKDLMNRRQWNHWPWRSILLPRAKKLNPCQTIVWKMAETIALAKGDIPTLGRNDLTQAPWEPKQACSKAENDCHKKTINICFQITYIKTKRKTK